MARSGQLVAVSEARAQLLQNVKRMRDLNMHDQSKEEAQN